MALNVLVDTDNLRIIKVAKTVQQLEFWADILCPLNDFKIQGHTKKAWSAYSDLEIRHMLTNMCGEPPPANAAQKDLYTYCHSVVAEFPVDETPLKDLKKRLGEEPPCREPFGPDGGQTEVLDQDAEKSPQIHTAEGEPPPPATEPKPAASAAPRKKGATKRVWEIADQLVVTGGKPTADPEQLKAFRAALIQACEAEGINKSTAGTQYSKWKKAQGI